MTRTFPKAPESFASDKERWDYLYYRLMGVPVKNEATAIDMDENAGLIVKLADGTTKTLSSGEVTLHGI